MSVGDTRITEMKSNDRSGGSRPIPPPPSRPPKQNSDRKAQADKSRSGWVAGQSYVHIGGLGSASAQDPILTAIYAQQRSLQQAGQVMSTTATFVELEVDRPTTVMGAVINAFTSTNNALLRNCPSIGTAKAAGDLILDGCPQAQSVQAGGRLALMHSEAAAVVPGFRSLTYLPNARKELRIDATGIHIAPPAPNVQPANLAPPPAPPKKDKKYCTRNCTLILLATAAAAAAAVWGYLNRRTLGNNLGVE